MLSLKLGVLQRPKLDLMIFHVFISVTINSFLPFCFHPVTLTQDISVYRITQFLPFNFTNYIKKVPNTSKEK